MLQVCGHRVLIKPKDIETESSGGIVLVVNERMEKAGQYVGVVHSIGPTAWKAFDSSLPDWKPWCNIGDTVVYAKYGGKFVIDPETEEEYVIINDEDCLCVIEEANNE